MRHTESGRDPAELGKRLGRTIAERRKAKNLTQDDLAGMVEVDAETISRFERGSVLPSLQRLFVVAAALDTGVGELLGEASRLPGDRARRLAGILGELDAKDQELLIDFAELLRRRS